MSDTNARDDEHTYRNAGWDTDIYPMPAFPMLTASNLERTRRWYIEVLGFADVFTFRTPDGAPLLAHLRWSRWADILITPARNPLPDHPAQGLTLNFMTVDADAIAEQAKARGATIIDGPVDRPWNARDVTIADPDGYRLNFTARQQSESSRTVSFEEVMERARKNV
ncbi:MAG TPA: VOC family protein [Gemmatimonadaceae bacterium]|jgi:catechol 2,3-dioxygenase-like lactoylglutathione lyase family enzyme|nr:VOC family protein [Gemmatimonadaceae bacterium]